jgi:molecular chaperone HscB
MTCPNRHEIDYFKLLGLPRVYNLNLQDAEERFRTLQKSAHPDKIDEIDAKNLPEGFSSLLNKAIKVLKSPTERAMHLLYLIDGCSLSESELTNDPGLLMEMMEANEAIDDCGTNKTCLEVEAELNQQRLDACDSELRNLFADRKFPAARKVCEKMHYLERIKDTLIRKLNSVQ